MSVTPEYPDPGVPLKIQAKSYLIDLNSSNIVWYVDGKRVKGGMGNTTLEMNAPSQGKKMEVKAIATANNISIPGNITIKPSSVDFIIESSGYKPPMFMGRNTIGYENTVRIIAIPIVFKSDGTHYKPENLIYKWNKNGVSVLNEQSGYGKYYIDMKGDIIPKPYNLVVEVTSPDGNVYIKKSVYVAPKELDLSFYVVDPVYGLLDNIATPKNKNIGNDEEITILASPFGLDGMDTYGRPNLDFNWSINNVRRTDLNKENIITLRTRGGASGTSNISFKVNNMKNILQSVGSMLSISFNNTRNSNTNDVQF
jgi:hypothetical protein